MLLSKSQGQVTRSLLENNADYDTNTAAGNSSGTRTPAPRGIAPRFLPREKRDEIEDIHLGLPKSD